MLLVFLSRAGPFNPNTGATPSAPICVVCLAWVRDVCHWCGMGLSQSHAQDNFKDFQRLPETFKDVRRLSLSQAGLFDPNAGTSLIVVLPRAGLCDPERRYSVLAFLSRAGPFNPSAGAAPSALICVVCLAWVRDVCHWCGVGLSQSHAQDNFKDFQRLSATFNDVRRISLSHAGLFDPNAGTSLVVVLPRAGPCNAERRY